LEIGTVTKTVFDETKDVIITWFGVLSQGEPAFASLDLATNSALLFALRFLFYISLADFAVSIPSSAANGVQNENRMFIGVSIASIYVEYLAFSLIIYGTMKLLGGKAPVQACIAGYCFLTADLPVAAVLRLPLVPIIDAALKAVQTILTSPAGGPLCSCASQHGISWFSFWHLYCQWECLVSL
jgi:hypothetical protein